MLAPPLPLPRDHDTREIRVHVDISRRRIIILRGIEKKTTIQLLGKQCISYLRPAVAPDTVSQVGIDSRRTGQIGQVESSAELVHAGGCEDDASAVGSRGGSPFDVGEEESREHLVTDAIDREDGVDTVVVEWFNGLYAKTWRERERACVRAGLME